MGSRRLGYVGPRGPDSEVGLAQRLIFILKIMIGAGGRWGAAGRPLASGIDAG